MGFINKYSWLRGFYFLLGLTLMGSSCPSTSPPPPQPQPPPPPESLEPDYYPPAPEHESNYEPANAKFLIVTHYTGEIADMARIAVKNQKAYAVQRGYAYKIYRRIVSGQFRDPGASKPVYQRGLYWQ